MELREKLVQIIAEEFDIDDTEITDDADFDRDLGADSLDITHLAMDLEEEFKIEVSDCDISRLTSLRTTMEYIRRVTNGRR